jgi:hypothetical protein
VSTIDSHRGARYGRLALLASATLVAALSACQAPFGLGEPSTRTLEDGATGTLAAANSVEITGSYTESGDKWSIDLQVVRPATQHVIVSKADLKLEAIIFKDPTQPSPADVAYFRGNQFLSQHLGNDTSSRNLVKAAGNAWWKGSTFGPSQVPRLPDLIDGAGFRTTFLGTAVAQRFDHVEVDGLEAVNLSGPRADVFVAATPPHHLLRVHMKKGAEVDGISDADLRFDFAGNFRIAAPTDVIDFSNLSTLPPIYTVLSVDVSGCNAPCVVSALLKNLGGKVGAQAPSTITFTMTDSASRKTIGSCQVQVQSDVGYNATTRVSCAINLASGQQANAALVTATPDNPGRA